MIVKKGQGQKRYFKGISFDVLARGTLAMVTLMKYTMGQEVPMHSHPNEQAGYLISGRVQISFAGNEAELEDGDSYVIPANCEHSLIALTDASVVDVFSPPRQDYISLLSEMVSSD